MPRSRGGAGEADGPGGVEGGLTEKGPISKKIEFENAKYGKVDPF